MEARPRPSGVRRVTANKRPRPDASSNSARKLQRREIAAFPERTFAASTTRERFRNIQLQEEFDTYDPKENSSLLPYLRKRSEIIEIVGARDIFFALSQLGVCAAFSRVTNQRICFLNGSPDEVIRSLFYNKNNDSLITVSVYGSENFSALRCRTTRIEYIRRGKPDAGFPLFETESLRWPGFVEFDDVNGKVLTYSAQDSTYKVFDLKNYTLLYTISDKEVQEIKISPGIMLLIYSRKKGYIPLEILSIEDGKRLKSFRHLLHRNKKIDFIEQFNEKLLVKQDGENLQILDVTNSKITEVSSNDFVTPSAFIFLYEMQLFLHRRRNPPSLTFIQIHRARASEGDRPSNRPTKKTSAGRISVTMVVALGPGRFYGGGLPRPRVFPGDRVDPPAPVTDALLCWARDAHWSMGGLGAKRLRLQGRIEGNLVKLRRTARRDARVSGKSAKSSKVRAAGHGPAPATLDDALGSDDDDSEDEAEVAAQEKALRRDVVDDDEESESGESEGEEVPLVTIAAAAKRKRARKLSDEFDRIAAAQQEDGRKKKPSAVAPAKAPLRKKAASAVAAPAPAPEAPAKKSLKRKAVAPAAGSAERTSPKRKAAEAPAARRTSPRSKH